MKSMVKSRSLVCAFSLLASHGTMAGPGDVNPAFAMPFGRFNDEVVHFAEQNNGRLLVAGFFTQVDGQPRNRIVRLMPDGTVDPSFTNLAAGANGVINAVAVDALGRVIIGGEFTSAGSSLYNRIDVLNSNGTFNIDFFPGTGAGGRVEALAVQPDNKILVAGKFTNFNNQACNNLVRLFPNGSRDVSFVSPNFNAFAFDALAVQPDGKILVGGSFNVISLGIEYDGLMRLHTNGTLDTSFSAGSIGFGFVSDIARQPDGRVVIGGSFTQVQGVARANIARLLTNGVLDTSFDPGEGMNGTVSGVFVQRDGRILAVGEFTTFQGLSRRALVRMHPNGRSDTAFNLGSGLDYNARVVRELASGRVLAGGSFDDLNGTDSDTLVQVMGVSGKTGDFNADTRSDFPVFNPATGSWYIRHPTTPEVITWNNAWGWNTARPMPSDYDGDGATDLAVYDTNGGFWYIKRISGEVVAWQNQWGWNTARPVPGDYDGDGQFDLAVFDTVGGFWYIKTVDGAGITWQNQWGWSTARPIPGDYNGDGRYDLAVFDTVGGFWYIKSITGAGLTWQNQWGWSTARPVPGDYDGDGRFDLAVFDQVGGFWYIKTLAGSVITWQNQWGWNTAKPVPGDYNGDGRYDLAVVDTTTGRWFVKGVDGKVIAWDAEWGWNGATFPALGD
jgi:uncharacterized delta-60 repeat protein